MRRRGAARLRGGGADAVLRARLPAGRVRGHRRARRRRGGGGGASGAPLVPHVRNEGHGLLEAVGEMIDVARRSGAPLHLSHLKSLADERLVEPLLELLDARRDLDRRDVRPVPLRRGEHAAREHPAGLGAGGRRAGDARRDRRPRRRGAGSRATSPTGCPAGRTSSARSGRSRSRSRTPRPPNEERGRADARGDRRLHAGATRSTAALDLLARVRARRDDGAPLRLRRRRPDDRERTACSSSARTGSSAPARTRGCTARRRASSGASRSARACCRWRRRSHGSRRARPTGSASPTGAGSSRAGGPTSSCSTRRATSTRPRTRIRAERRTASSASG